MRDRLSEYGYFLHGGDYSPEQWKDTAISVEKDYELQRRAACNAFTVGMFAWSDIEREEGVFDFTILDKVIKAANENGTKIILATPSGARPRWLAEKYPEVLRVGHDNERERFNTRHNHCFTSPAYREKVRIYNERLAERYADDPAVIAWHVSNEYSYDCCCPLCMAKFRDYLRKKFDNDIEKLNFAYCTSFWSHRYRDFEEIENPFNDRTIHGLILDWRRFSSEQTVNFMQSEIRALKKYSRDVPVTTNMMPGYYHIDYTRFKGAVDFMSVDNYPEWNGPSHIDEAIGTSFWFSYFYGIKKRPFLLMESVLGAVSWRDTSKLKTSEMETLSALQAIACGSDSVLYFQWRKSRGNYEKFHGAVIDHYGKEDTRIFGCVKKNGELLKALKEIKGAEKKKNDVAVFYDMECRWALDESRGYSNRAKGYLKTCLDFYGYFWRNSVGADVIGRDDELDGYKLVILPMLYMTDKSLIGKIAEYTANGGCVYANLMLGIADENDLCYTGGVPADKLKEVFGIRNEEVDTLFEDQSFSIKIDGTGFVGKKYIEHIVPCGAKVLAESEWEVFGRVPALTLNEYGKGKAYYQSVYEESGFKERNLKMILKELCIEPFISCVGGPRRGLTASVREKNGTEYMFVQNFSDAPAEGVWVNEGWSDFFTKEKVGEIRVDKYGYKVLTRKVARRKDAEIV